MKKKIICEILLHLKSLSFPRFTSVFISPAHLTCFRISRRNKKQSKHHSYEVESKMRTIHYLIRKGANSFLRAEYLMCLLFIVVFGAVIFFFISYQGSGVRTFRCFICPSLQSFSPPYTIIVCTRFARYSTQAPSTGHSDLSAPYRSVWVP